MEIRKANEKDIDEIMNLSNYYIEKTVHTWQRETRTRDYYEKWITDHKEKHPIFVGYSEGGFVGYGSLSPFRGVSGYDKICENSLYLAVNMQGKGYGKVIMQKLIDEAKRLGYWAMTAWIDSENEFSIDFHKNFGFYEVGVMRKIGNKFGKRLSTYILQLDFK